MLENSFINRVLHKALWLALLPLCVLAPAFLNAAHNDAGQSRRSPPSQAAELPTEWQGQRLRPLALSALEARFAKRFPGTLNRLTDGRQVFVVRDVTQPTRMLHPAVDCYQGLGYRIAAQQLALDDQQRLWRCFEASRNGQRLRVCERITDAQGQGFTDTSAWYWAALLGQSHGPWQAITVASPL